MKPLAYLLPASLVLVAAAGIAQITPEMETGWMDLVKGSMDAEGGAQVREVSSDAETGERRITIAIPKDLIDDVAMMEEVTVIGRAPDKIEINLPDFETEWIDGYDSEYYGLLVRLKDGPETPIRLFFSAAGAGTTVGGPQP